jgi:hypothetical protein
MLKKAGWKSPEEIQAQAAAPNANRRANTNTTK